MQMKIRTVIRCAVTLAVAHHASALMAQGIECLESAAGFQATPASIEVPNTISAGDVLTPWLDIAQTELWRCREKNPAGDGGAPIYIGVQAAAAMPSGSTASIDGLSHPVFLLAGTGLGYVARWRGTSAGNTYSDWQALGNIGATPASRAQAPAGMKEFSVGAQLQIRYVRTRGALRRGPLSGFNIAAFSLLRGQTRNKSSASAASGTSAVTASVPGGLYQVLGSTTCRTGDADDGAVYVDLGSIPVSALSGPEGTRAAAKKFAIHLQDCPPDYGRILYTFTPPARGILTDGVLRTREGHEGFGIQLRHGENSSVVEFGATYQLDAYSGAGGNYAIDMEAALYRYGSGAITTGSFTAEAHYRIDYE